MRSGSRWSSAARTRSRERRRRHGPASGHGRRPGRRRPRRTGRRARSDRPGSATRSPRRGGRATSAMTRRSTRSGSPALTPSRRASSGVAASDVIVACPRRSWSPARASASCREPALEVGRHHDVRGAPDEDRRLDRDRQVIGQAQAPDQHDRVPGSDRQRARLGVRRRADLPREQPRARASGPGAASRCENAIRRSANRCAGGTATNVPRPGIRSTRPSSARRCIALRAVIRLTPNSRHRSLSDGSRSPGRSVGTRSRSASSIWR